MFLLERPRRETSISSRKEIGGNKTRHNFRHSSLQEMKGMLWAIAHDVRKTHTHTHPTQSSVFPNRINCLTFWLLLFDRLIWWRPGDSRFTSSAISCNISLAKMELFQDQLFIFLCDFCCEGEIFFSALDLVLFAIPFSFTSAFVVFSFFSFFFPVQCPAHEVRFDSTGVILSPGFPENYPNLQMCSWLINVEKGYNITLHFELFQTEKEFDILEIFDGKSLS